MKLKVLVLLFATQMAAQSVFANCNVYVPVTDWNYYGYPIDLTQAIDQMLTDKKYKKTEYADLAAYRLNLNVEGKDQGLFRHATAEYQWVKTLTGELQQKEFSKRCITNLCAIYDFVKPIEKLMKELHEKIPNCG